MLSRMLLHVVAAAFKIDAAMNFGARSGEMRWSFEIVDDSAIFGIRNLCHSQTLRFAGGVASCKPSGVMDLSAAGGIEGRLAQDDCGARSGRRGRNIFDDGIELVRFRIFVVEAFRHDKGFEILPLERRAFRPSTTTAHGFIVQASTQKSGTGGPLHTKEPVTVASFRTWRGWRENVARNRCLTLHLSKRLPFAGMKATCFDYDQITLWLSQSAPLFRN